MTDSQPYSLDKVTPPDRSNIPSRSADDMRDRTTTRKAAVYARTGFGSNEAAQAQFDVCRKSAIAEGYAVPDCKTFLFADEGMSSGSASQTELHRLLEAVRSGHAAFDRIYVRDMDRITRDNRFLRSFDDECMRFGIDLCIATDVPKDDASRKINYSNMKLFMEAARASIEQHAGMKRRCRIGKQRRIEAGFHVSGCHPFATERWLARVADRTPVERMPERGGLKRSGHAVVLRWIPDRLPAVTLIFERLAAGSAIGTIVRELNLSFPPPREGARWHSALVRRIARNPIYAGDLLFPRGAAGLASVRQAEFAVRDTGGPIYVRGYMPDAPVSQSLFRRVQLVLDGKVGDDSLSQSSNK